MKQTKLAPKNRDFFTEHGGSLSAYGIIGALGQLLSGLSLAYAVFALLVAQVFAGGHLDTGSFAGLVTMAIVVAFFVELSNRVLARRAIRPFVVKDLFADDQDVANRHKILNRSYIVGLVAVALLSYLLSIVGSTYYAEDTTEGPELVSLDSIAGNYADQRADVLLTFSADSATLASPYDVQLIAALSGFSADSSAFMRQRSRYEKCANEDNPYCKNQRGAFLIKIDERRAELATATAELSQQRAAVLAAALATRNERLAEYRAAETTTVMEAKATNTLSRDERDADSGFKGLVFIILTVAGQTLYYFMVFLQLQVEAGSQIDHELKPNEFWGMPSIIQELRTTAAWRLERGLRRLIRWAFGEPNDDHETAIPYADLYGNDNDNGDNNAPVTNGPVIAVNGTLPKTKTVVVDTAIRQCVECGKDYRPKVWNQKFCDKTCKGNYHAKKHNGRTFDPGRYHGRKPSKI